MAAAYASLVSLLNTMDQIQIHPLLSTYFNEYQNKSLRKNVDFLVDFVENYSDSESEEVEDLVRRIAMVAHEAEDIIEVHAADRIRAAASNQQSPSSLPDLQKRTKKVMHSIKEKSMPRRLHRIIKVMDSIKKKLIKAKQETGFINQKPPPSSSSPATAETTTMVENYSEAEGLVRRMAAVTLEAEEIIQVIKVVEYSFKEKSRSLLPPPSSSSSSSSPPANAKTTATVGFDGYVEQLLDELTGHQSDRRILPIVGMGGIGKTTLARNVYQNSLTVEHFYVRAWVTASQQFSATEILLQALSCLGRSTSTRNDSELGEELHKTLCGWRYLIVLDDVWSVEAWEEIRFFFPENNNGSRIVVTTRQSEVVDYFGSSALAVDFLDHKNSWDLFCEKTFGCPPELEQVGKKIVKRCRGLPLAIILVGGLLGKSPRTQEYWEKVAEDKSLILDSGVANEPLSILNLSYKHLPVWLKPCLVYLGLFPEDHRIDVSQLIKLWVAEGFIKPKSEQSLEEVAESYLKELVGRNLVLVGELRLNKKLETCYVHDLVRELCMRIGEKENFYCVQRDIDGKRQFIFDETTARFYSGDSHTPKMPSLIHPLIIDDGERRAAPFKSRLLRVLLSVDTDLTDTEFAFRQLNLRFSYSSMYSRTGICKLPSSILQFWSMQTLIIDEVMLKFVAPPEIWKMPQLRHIDVFAIHLPLPSDLFVLHNLQTLKQVVNLSLSEEVCKRIPNVKDLHIRYDCYHFHNFRYDCYDLRKHGGASSCYHLQNLGCLTKLESLSYYCGRWDCVGDSLQNLKLPSSLKELNLIDCHLEWSDMAMIASLPHLQILQLYGKAIVGSEWKFVDEKFLCLKHLQILHCPDLIHFIADSSNFPVLETLYLKELFKLEEIPSGFGEIPTLERIEMFDCRRLAATVSAANILEEQESLGNEGLHIKLKFWGESDANMWREKIEELGIMCQNIHVSTIHR